MKKDKHYYNSFFVAVVNFLLILRIAVLSSKIVTTIRNPINAIQCLHDVCTMLRQG